MLLEIEIVGITCVWCSRPARANLVLCWLTLRALFEGVLSTILQLCSLAIFWWFEFSSWYGVVQVMLRAP